MKRIGILSFWGTPNYGCFWQMYALQQAIAELYPDAEVKQIAYLHRIHYGMYYDLFWKTSRHWPISHFFYKNLFHRLLHYQELKDRKKFLAYYEWIPHTMQLDKKQIGAASFDAVVLGSDIIWDYSMDVLGHDPYLFGVGLNSSQIISYAPSFGTVKSTNNPPNYVLKGLNQLQWISVRDRNSAALVKQYMGKKAEVVVDPTFLIDFEQIKRTRKLTEEPYIVVYGSHFQKQLIKEAVAYAHSHQLKLICLDSGGDYHDWCDLVIPQNQLDPFAWISYFKYAAAVFTCTYHGLLFGLIYKKPIIFSPTDFILAKAASFIESLGLTSVLTKNWSFTEKVDWSWNYNQIDQQLDVLKVQSREFLKQALKK